jgi:hypothetical protein
MGRPCDAELALTYNQVLNQTIEDILFSLAQNVPIQNNELGKLVGFRKADVSYIAVLNLQYIEKLSYILRRCAHSQNTIDHQFVQS